MSYLSFPPPSGPLLVPTSSRRAVRAGVALWSASRLRARVVQRAYWLVGGLIGPGFIPARRHLTVDSVPEEIEREHGSVWRTWFGGWDEQAVYRPSQADRTGVALLLLREGRPRGFVKVRPRWDAGPEQRATSRLGEAETFTAPTVLGIHVGGGWTSLGFTALPGRIHSPRVSAPIRAISEEVSELVRLDSPCPPGWRPMHGDMGPWNLRNMPGIGPVLFDWENVAPAPPFADEVFYLAAAKAVGLAVQRHSDLDEEALVFWRDKISRRLGTDRREDRLATDMLRALVSFER
jgi:hypothetical protein